MEHRQVLLVGFGPMEDQLRPMLEQLGLEVQAVGGSRLNRTIGELCLNEEVFPQEEALDRGLVLFHNFTQDQLDPVLKALREAGIPRQPLKAMVTPTNWHWTVKSLYKELEQEQEFMTELFKLKQLRDRMPMPAFTDIPAMKARMMAEVQLSGGEGVTAETIRKAYTELQKFAD